MPASTKTPKTKATVRLGLPTVQTPEMIAAGRALRKKRTGKMETKLRERKIATLKLQSPQGGNSIPRESKNIDRKLTEKQLMFVRVWAEGESISTAAYRAGLGDVAYCAKLSRDPAVLRIYHAEKAKYEEACQMTRKKVMDGFLEAVEIAKVQGESLALTSAWREVAKMCGYYEPVKRTIDINVHGTLSKLGSASDAELLKLINDADVIDVVAKEVIEVDREQHEALGLSHDPLDSDD